MLNKVKRIIALWVIALCWAWTIWAGEGSDLSAFSLTSPDGRLAIGLDARSEGLMWSLKRDGKTLVEPSRLGLRFLASRSASPELGKKMKVVGHRTRSSDSTWETRLYRRGTIRDHYRELVVDLEEIDANAVRVGLGQTELIRVPRKLSVVFRAYDEGVAFRYVLPKQEAFEGVQLLNELTEWRLEGDPELWTTSYANSTGEGEEKPFCKSRVSELDSSRYIGMPVVCEFKTAHVAFCEAALSNWSALYFQASNGVLHATLSKIPPTPAASPDIALIAMMPAESPWRVAIVGDDGLDLLNKNDIILNLNPAPDPSIDFSFVKPGPSTWDWWVESNNSLSTERTIKLVDFAAEMGWPYHTVDGGWYGFSRQANHGPNVPLEPRKEFDLDRIVSHAKVKRVGIWVWIHWMQIRDIGLEETFSRLEKWGIVGVKTDFLNRSDQEIVNWCESVCRAAARHHIMVNFHGSFRPTGIERTWPNCLTREAVLGNEINIFRKAITPEHCATLPFTRYLIGPGDFTPGSFANVFSADFVPQTKKGHRYADETDRCPHWAEEMGTRAHAIAQCIAFDSPLMTLCDWPERYRGQPGVEALRNLPASWKNTTPIAGRCGEYYAVIRESHEGKFYFAAMTVDAREISLKLDFLGEGAWAMRVFADDPAKTPADAKAIRLEERVVTKDEAIAVSLCNEGGAVVILEKIGTR